MSQRRTCFRAWIFGCLFAGVILLSACATMTEPADCPFRIPADIGAMAPYAEDDQGPFRFPLDDLSPDQQRPSAYFQTNGLETPSRREFHAAEDWLSPPGTPVYAIADGHVTYSGRREGYGWLVIVDHPQANLYSLYGHLSPSRWQIDKVPVKKGDLLGYLGDSDENGGTAEQPLRPHLHLGLRAGQRAGYPSSGEWRWMAGWITPCPSDVGWLQPSKILTAQAVPPGGFSGPSVPSFQRWGFELILTAIYLAGAIIVSIYAWRRDKPYSLLFYGVTMLVAGLFLGRKGLSIAPLLFGIAAVTLAQGIIKLVGRRRNRAAGGDDTA